jgi:hypothetical protein
MERIEFLKNVGRHTPSRHVFPKTGMVYIRFYEVDKRLIINPIKPLINLIKPLITLVSMRYLSRISGMLGGVSYK